jgi:hypothetical protein
MAIWSVAFIWSSFAFLDVLDHLDFAIQVEPLFRFRPLCECSIVGHGWLSHSKYKKFEMNLLRRFLQGIFHPEAGPRKALSP